MYVSISIVILSWFLPKSKKDGIEEPFRLQAEIAHLQLQLSYPHSRPFALL